MPGIVTLTLNPAVDKSCSIRQVVPDRKLRCSAPVYHPGGGGINVARAITKLGGDVAAYWTCGGAIGSLLKSLLDEDGVPHHPLQMAAMTRENLIVFEEASGQQFRFGMPGAKIEREELDSILEELRSIDPPPDYVVLSGSLPAGVDDNLYATIAATVPEASRVVLDTSGDPLRHGLSAGVFLVKPNINELGQLAGHPIEDDAQLREEAQKLIHKGRAQVVVTSLGSAGVTFTTADDHRHIRAPTVKIRSKVGAGDSTVAGLVLALSQGKDVADAVLYGVAAGTAAVMTDGTELCRREDVDRLYGELKAT